MPNNHYIALSAGPIYKTLSNVRQTRELWAASYAFSYLMKNIAERLKEDETRLFILPYMAFTKQYDGVGRFPDRLIFKTENPKEDFEAVKKVINDVLKDFAQKVSKKIETSTEGVEKFCHDYFQFYIIQKELPDGKNPILELSPDIEAIELQRNYALKAENYLERFLNNMTTSFLVKDGFNKENKFFDSIIEIAARQFKDTQPYKALKDQLREKNRKEESDDDENLIVELGRTQGNKFRTAHKYIAIVHADGDHIGETIERIDCQKDDFVKGFETFSKKLSDFSADAVKMITSYGGLPVYAGGDDLLFFAPVFNENGQNTEGGKMTDVFDLIEKLDKLFSTKIDNDSATLSCGVSITYYKYPLAEAVETSRNLMFQRAKKTANKNCVSFKVVKHSGTYFEADFQIRNKGFEQFRNLLKAALLNDDDLLKSVMYRIRQNDSLFKAIGNEEDRVKAFINNSFNEKIHKEDAAKHAFLNAVKKLIPTVFEEITQKEFYTEEFTKKQLKGKTKDEYLSERALHQVYALLRLVEFIAKKSKTTPVEYA